MDYLESLNPMQQKAVTATEGPVLIVAGAGAGKTKTITHRIFHLIHQGVSPHNILAITFTNKAAKEMRERVLFMLQRSGITIGTPLLSTFHSLGVRIIREHAPLLGLSRDFTIIDTTDQKKIIKDILQKIGLDPKEHLEKIYSIISHEKGRGTSCESFLERDSYDFTSESTKKVWEQYERTKKENQVLDFDDLLLKTRDLLQKNVEVRTQYQTRWKYIHVDEYQDTNAVQNDIVDLLAAGHKNICVVGDTDQNIYSWRGAQIKNMLHFEKTYPDVTTIFLEQNYRSTKTILEAANAVIEKNTYRIPKKLFTENESGEEISLFSGHNETDEAHFIALSALECIEKGTPAQEIAVLYRANFQSRILEEAMMAYNVPYELIGTKFFERREIKDVMAYIHASCNPSSWIHKSRIINIPRRGIGDSTLAKIERNETASLPGSVRFKIREFDTMLTYFGDVLRNQKLSEAIRLIIEKSGLEKMYLTHNDDDIDRLENMMELVTLARRYDELPPEEALLQFLSDTALMSDQDEMGSRSKSGGVKLLTVHSSKGLEFDVVFVSGLEEGVFPHNGFGTHKKTEEDSEEERRLFYVALTRARKKLFLTYAQTRTIFGNTEMHNPSSFLYDIPRTLTNTVGFDGKEERKGTYFRIDF